MKPVTNRWGRSPSLWAWLALMLAATSLVAACRGGDATPAPSRATAGEATRTGLPSATLPPPRPPVVARPAGLGGGYERANWGMNTDQVKAVMRGTVREEGDGLIVANLDGARVDYSFFQGRLFRVEQNYPASANFETVVSGLSERFGTGVRTRGASPVGGQEDVVTWSDSLMSVEAHNTISPPRWITSPIVVRYQHTADAAARMAEARQR